MRAVFLTTLSWFLSAIEIFLFARVVLSWITTGGPMLKRLHLAVYNLTEPILQPIRALIEHSIFRGNGNVFDISPLIAFIVIDAIKRFL